MAQLRKKVQVLEAEVRLLKAPPADQYSETDSLKWTLQNQQADIRSLEVKIATMQAEIEHLRN